MIALVGAFLLVPVLGRAQQELSVANAGVSGQVRPGLVAAKLVSIELKEVSLRRAIDRIAERAGVRVQYQEAVVDAVTTPVSLRVENVDLRVVLDRALAGSGLEAVVTGKSLFTVRPARTEMVEDGTIVGRVVSAKGNTPIVGAQIFVGEHTASVVTDNAGNFRVTVPPGEHRVSIRAVGYARQVRSVTVAEGQQVTMEIVLDIQPSVLNEVVVTGTVIETERKAITTPITVITAEEIERRGLTRIEELFRGEVPGVIALEEGAAVYSSSNLGAMQSANVYARGSSSMPNLTSDIPAANPLKTYVDGVEIQDPQYLGTIDPQSIERIELVTGPQAATIYGSGAMGGVLQIFTKKGINRGASALTISLRYGVLESNLNSSFTPMHNDVLSVTGGSGIEFTYSGTLSYNYSGQWQPDLYSRRFGASVGATHTRGQVTASGSVSTTSGKNGTGNGSGSAKMREWAYDGTLVHDGQAVVASGITSEATSQTVMVSIDHRPFHWITHTFTAGRSQNRFSLLPEAPVLRRPSDSLYRTRGSDGMRTSGNYNVTLSPRDLGVLTPFLTIGANGSTGRHRQFNATKADKVSTSMTASSISESTQENFGGFGALRLGIFDQLFLTMGLRAERNPTYGQDHKIDWTPTNGVAYTLSLGDLSVKLLGSYGRATRPPTAAQRLEVIRNDPNVYPSTYISYFGNPNLTPEYSRGPQGGIEVYYGQLGSFTLNRYKQKVSDLIEAIAADSILVERVRDGFPIMRNQYQWQNTATVEQHGWESTISSMLWRISLKGAYAWNDSRVLYSPLSHYYRGMSSYAVPTHTGNISIAYAANQTSISISTNFVGASIHRDARNSIGYWLSGSTSRLGNVYSDQGGRPSDWEHTRPGYFKSDMVIQHRMSQTMTFTMNMTNLGNSFGSQGFIQLPALGRQTLLGVTWRPSAL